MKKLISFLLVLATLLSCLAVSVTASPSATFKSDEGQLPFEDIRDTHWFAEALEFCYANGIIKGMNEYTFDFSGQLTRAQFVTMLAGLENVDTSAYTVSKFTDVKSNHWYYGAVAWAYENGIVSGMTETTFVPGGVLTRAQLATVMRNYMEGKYEVEVRDDALDKFTDKPKESYWYYDAMKFAVSAELLSGNSDGTLAATGNVTRAQAVVIFKSFMEKYFYGACEHVFSEADCTNAPICEKCGLVNGLPNGHRIVAYNCVTTDICLDCGTEVAPSNLAHAFIAATCTEPRICNSCGATRGEAKGHSWINATCTAPKTCSNCKLTEGSAYGHDFSFDNCPRCGTASPFSRLRWMIRSCGDYDYESHSYNIRRYYPEDSSIFFFLYDVAEDAVYAAAARYDNTGAFDVSMVQLSKNGNIHDLMFIHCMPSGEVVFVAQGKIDASTYSEDTRVSFTSYMGESSNMYMTISNASYCTAYAIRNLDFWGSNQCGVEAEDFGFINY